MPTVTRGKNPTPRPFMIARKRQSTYQSGSALRPCPLGYTPAPGHVETTDPVMVLPSQALNRPGLSARKTVRRLRRSMGIR